ncbi:MAG: esterase/lipase family protein [Saprospiraceae bacterium]
MYSPLFTYRLRWACLSIAIAFASVGTAQSVGTAEFTDFDAMIHHIYEDLDQSEITTGLLAERTLPFFPLRFYRGDSSRVDSLALDLDSYTMGVASLFGMAQDSLSAASLVTLDFRDNLPSISDTLELSSHLFQFNYIDSVAAQNGAFIFDTVAQQIYNSPGWPTNPYLLDTVSLFSSLTKEVNDRTFKLRIASDHLYTNLGSSIDLSLDYGSGYFPLIVDSLYTITLPNHVSDTFYLSLRSIVGSDTLTAFAKTIVAPQQRMMMGTERTVPIAGGGGNLVYFSEPGCENEAKNIIIFVGGYDPNNDRNGAQVTLAKLEYRLLSNPSLNPDLRTMQELIEDANLEIVFVDWANGGARLQDNGLVVANAIKTINADKEARGIITPSVIVGQSMGGLCTRYGLWLLEQEAYEHRISKYFSWDTPHRGANVPINFQLATAYLLDLRWNGLPAIRAIAGAADRASNSDASRQMKLWHGSVSNKIIPLKKELIWSEEEHLTWQAEYDAISINVPFYALSNGSSTRDQNSASPVNNRTVLNGSKILSSVRISPGRAGLYSVMFMDLDAEFRTGHFRCNGLYRLGFMPSIFPFRNKAEPSLNGFNYDLMPASVTSVGLNALGGFQAGDSRFWPEVLSILGFHIRKHTDYFAYVPTWSSQYADRTSSVPVSLQNRKDVDAFAFSIEEPHPPTSPGGISGLSELYNHDHVSFTPQIGAFFIQNAIEKYEEYLFSASSSESLDIRYNFGVSADGESTPNRISGIKSVEPGAAILVNFEARIRNVIDATNPYNNLATFNLDLSPDECLPAADITINSGAEFIVGENISQKGNVYAFPESRVTIKNGGELIINEGSAFLLESNGPDNLGGIVIEPGGILDARNGGVLYLQYGGIRVKSGGTLRTTNEGVIYAGYGGRIILEDGAIVDLEGGDEPEGEGQVWIHTQGTLEIQGDYSLSGNGYFHFSPENYVTGPGPLKITNSNRDYRRMVLDASTSVILTNGQEFYGRNAEIQYGNSSSIFLISGAAADVRNCVFQGGDAAIVSNLTGKVNIRHSDFIESQIGVEFNTSANAIGSANIRSCKFEDCRNGILAKHDGLFNSLDAGSFPLIRTSEFVNCNTGLGVLSHPSVKVLGSSFTSSGNDDVAVNGYFSGKINMIGCEVFGYDSGDGATSITLNNTEELILDAGQYHDNGHVVTITALSSITMTECVEITANKTGVYCVPFAGGSTINFNGSTWSGTPVG